MHWPRATRIAPSSDARREKRFDERGLAEAGVTGHEHDAAPAAEHVVEEAVEALELGLASDDGKRLLSYLRRSGSRCRAGCGHDASRLGDRQAELLDELARLAQIDGVEALGEARVDAAHQLARNVSPALVTPQPPEAHGSAQLEHRRTEPSGDLERLGEARLRLLLPA